MSLYFYPGNTYPMKGSMYNEIFLEYTHVFYLFFKITKTEAKMNI